jgi:hypothetical protein
MIKSLCLLTTYRCNARCGFCECRPENADALSLADMTRYIDEAHSLGTVCQVVFSGGEPTLLGDDLFAAIAHAKRRGLLTRVVTNGHWGGTPARAEGMLDRLIGAGLDEINISVDDLHQQWIPLENVKNAFQACVRRQFRCLLAHKVLKNAILTRAFLEGVFGVKLIPLERDRQYTPEEACRLIATGVVIPAGPAPEGHVPSQLEYGRFRGNCGSLLRDVVVSANHRLLACCGIVTKNLPELTFGDLRQTPLIDAIDEANRDLVVNWLALEGPSAIAEFVHRKEPSIPLEDRYTGMCHLCNELLTRNDIRRVIEEHAGEIVDRVTLHRGFLEAARADTDLANLYTSRN